MKCDCPTHGKNQDMICIHPRLQMYICKECYDEWPEPTITISSIPYDEQLSNLTNTNYSITYSDD